MVLSNVRPFSFASLPFGKYAIIAQACISLQVKVLYSIKLFMSNFLILTGSYLHVKFTICFFQDHCTQVHY